MGLPAALGKYFADAATSPRHGNTTDPAGVSAPVKLRLSRAVADAVDHDDDLQAARASLARVSGTTSTTQKSARSPPPPAS